MKKIEYIHILRNLKQVVTVGNKKIDFLFYLFLINSIFRYLHKCLV